MFNNIKKIIISPVFSNLGNKKQTIGTQNRKRNVGLETRAAEINISELRKPNNNDKVLECEGRQTKGKGKAKTRMSTLKRSYSTLAQEAGSTSKVNGSCVRNELRVELLPKSLSEKVFFKPETQNKNKTAKKNESINFKEMTMNLSKEHLKRKGLYKENSEPEEFKIDLKDFVKNIPGLIGKDIEEHFVNLGKMSAYPYIDWATKLSTLEKAPKKPLKEDIRLKNDGWTRYEYDEAKESFTIERVDIPCLSESALVFDIESMSALHGYPVMAAAMSERAWYIWLSPYLVGTSHDHRWLIPLTTSKEQSEEELQQSKIGIPNTRKQSKRLVIGHNVGFDRSRVQDEYSLRASENEYIDTMSLHIASNGMSSQQKLVYKKFQSVKKKSVENEGLGMTGDAYKHHQAFMDVSSTYSLKDVAKFYYNIDMDKEIRNIFFEGCVTEVRQDIPNLIEYCMSDVSVTFQVYKKTFQNFLKLCPHPVSFAGMLMLGKAFLPVNTSQWRDFIDRCEGMLNEMKQKIESKLAELAEKALVFDENNKYMDDPWLKHLDWSKKETRYREKSMNFLNSKPKWYKELYDRKEKRIKITVRNKIAPYLLRISWLGFPLYHSRRNGWTFRVPNEYLENEHDSTAASLRRMNPIHFSNDTKEIEEERTAYNDREHAKYFKIPHKDGEEANCGSPLSKVYIAAYEKGILTSDYSVAKEALEINMVTSYWISARERVKSQFVVDFHDQGIILPLSVPMGTITRRTVESTWATASNAKSNRIGSELKTLVKAPEGYKFVGADVDSEELWIASLIGDSQFGEHGATSLGFMTLMGNKNDGTDLHSTTAKIMGISRNDSKVFNYSRIYGAGVKHATQLLLQANQTIGATEAAQRAKNLYLATKGHKSSSRLNNNIITRVFGKNKPFWHGGTESYMFNALESIATSDNPRTPVLGCGIAEGLRASAVGDGYMTSRVNWVVQSSGVDYLHLLLISMDYLITKFDIDARFVLSIHDEIRYLSSDADVYRTALALQIANLWTRSLFSYKLDISNLPISVAFFSAVDVDTVLRKETNLDCITPSNPVAIPHGESYDMNQIIGLTNGGRLESTHTCDSKSTPVDRLSKSYTYSYPTNMQQSPQATEALLPSEKYMKLKLQMAENPSELYKFLTEFKSSLNKGAAYARLKPKYSVSTVRSVPKKSDI
ncbi:DNA polymerase gamma, mitochondrial [Zancudomyces culisetae]|uniref:Mitochondrial DNA polymerase catalytic subunit n=1 Tax=Zancudomyces culisetae TaxID=1213189 RepID=A0A1R1PWG7_ZANCU|nr:DNA polymerase gamma, mitochondrial [Zancudomyces culisetae]|eukprot:OMH85253.1 DNA polymerase gamma, mitochondrial [Zancudomyces culisetae]